MKNAPTADPPKRTKAKDFRVQVEEQIRRHAHELYEKRGRLDGDALHDWLKAEAELTEVTGLKSEGVSA
jgi:hypothetical protein